ncbi:hypothetical protein [Acidovorax sp. ACV01]|uniref:hypothetical protein n=1 Tax=Acidovorax sp. ACV01 TaxID=2769311 RepID=UPI001CE10008|nr:hypothetical protein [Acidovorax sp. ACV01]
MNTSLRSSPLSPSPASISRVAVWASRTLDVMLLGLCVVLVALSYYSFTLYCENFGCLGVGLLWMVWAVLATVGWVGALVLRAWQRRRGLCGRASGLASRALLVMGVGHLLYWLGKMALK